jgi:hypothetical protein
MSIYIYNIDIYKAINMVVSFTWESRIRILSNFLSEFKKV